VLERYKISAVIRKLEKTATTIFLNNNQNGTKDSSPNNVPKTPTTSEEIVVGPNPWSAGTVVIF
jgi:hypothetical protein